jgi:hypothetical protein
MLQYILSWYGHEKILCQLLPTPNERIELLIKRRKAPFRVLGNRIINMDIACLPNAVDPISRLGLFGRVPPAAIVNHMVGFDQCQANACYIWREHKDMKAGMFSKSVHNGTAGLTSATRSPPTASCTIDDIHVRTKCSPNDGGQELLHVKSAREDKGFFLFLLDGTQTVKHRLELWTLGERLCHLKGFIAWH